MVIWPGKAPGTVAEFTLDPQIDAGDAIDSFTATVGDGDVVIGSSSKTDTRITIWLSGGTAGTTARIDFEIVTDDGRTFAESATLQIIDKATDDLAAFRLRYPAFATVPDETITYWIGDADRAVDSSWSSPDIDPARFAHAAHMMVETGVLTGKIPAGVTSFKSGTFSATIADSLASAEGYRSTIYGRQFLALRRASLSGPRGVWNPPANVC